MDLAASRAPSKTRAEDGHQRGPVDVVRGEEVEVDGVVDQRRHLPFDEVDHRLGHVFASRISARDLVRTVADVDDAQARPV